MIASIKPLLSAAILTLLSQPAHAAWFTTDLGLVGPTALGADGTVLAANWLWNGNGFTNYPVLIHPDGTRTTLGADLQGYAMNPSGNVVGQKIVRRDVLGGDPGLRHAFIYRDGKVIDLGTLGGHAAYATAVNGQGTAVGVSIVAGGAEHAFVSHADVLRDLGTLGGTYSIAHAINDAGQIAGVSTTADGSRHAFISDGRTMRSLGTTSGKVVALTANGTVVTESGDIFGPAGGVVRTGATFLDANERGEIVGAMAFDGQEGYSAVVYRNGAFTNLGTLSGGMYSRVSDINSRGQMVGFSHTASGPYTSFLYSDGKMHDLRDLVTDFSSVGAGTVQINDRGQVLGVGMKGGEYRAFLLTDDRLGQVPEPASLWLAGGLFTLLLARRRNKAPLLG